MNIFESTLKDFVRALVEAPSKFRINEVVQHTNGGPLMVVSGFVYHRKNGRRIICQWYGRPAGITMRQEFSEREVGWFDPYNPECLDVSAIVKEPVAIPYSTKN